MKTRREKMKKSFSLVIAGCVVLLTALFLWASQIREQCAFHAGQGVVAIAVIALAAISVIVVYGQAKSRNEKLRNMQADYREVFDQVMEWVGQSALQIAEKREVEEEVMAIFLEAQASGRAPESLIGGNAEGFAKEILHAYGIHPGILSYLLTSSQWYLIYLVVVQGYRGLRTGIGSYYAASMDLEVLILFAWISFVTLPLIQYGGKAWVVGKRKQGLFAILGFASFLVGVGIIEGMHLTADTLPWVSKLLARQVTVFKSPWHLALAVIAAISIFWLKPWLRKRPLR
jgi:DNA-binding ferritin-like protein (Dps family)